MGRGRHRRHITIITAALRRAAGGWAGEGAHQATRRKEEDKWTVQEGARRRGVGEEKVGRNVGKQQSGGRGGREVYKRWGESSARRAHVRPEKEEGGRKGGLGEKQGEGSRGEIKGGNEKKEMQVQTSAGCGAGGGGCRGEDVGGYGGAAGAKASAREGNGGASKEDERDLERERKPGGSGGPGGGKWGDGGRKRNVRAFLRRRRRRRRRRVVGARRPAAGAAGVKKWAGVSEKRGVGGVFNNELERSEDGRLGGSRRARERLGAGEDAIREEEEEEEEGEKAPREGKRPEEPTCFSEHGKAQEHKGVVCSVLCVVVGSKTQKKRGRGFSQSVGPRGLSSCASPLSSRHPSQEGAVDEGREGGGGAKVHWRCVRR